MKLGFLVLVLASAGCIGKVSINDRPCPCAAGWRCEPATQTCVMSDVDGGVGTDGSSGTDDGSRTDGGGPPLIVTFDERPSDPSNLTVATFGFHVDDVYAARDCKIDDGPFVPCYSPFETTPLADGIHHFTVRATSTAERSGFATVSWAIDTVVPTVSIESGPSGSVASSSATFTFASDDAAAVLACELDGGGFVPCESPQMLAGLAHGAHLFKVRALDPATNAAVDERSWFVDTAPPVIMFTGGPDMDIADRTPVFTFTVTGAASIECQTDDTGFAPCSSPFTTPSLADGDHAVTVRAANNAGNAATETRSFHVDTVGPVVDIAAVTSPTGVSPSIAFTVADTRAIRTAECRVDDGTFATCRSPLLPLPLGNGSHTVFVRASDFAGNTTVESTSFVVSAPAYRHTIRLDGSNDFFGSADRGELVPTTSGGFPGWFVLAFVTWDDDKLYLAWETSQVGHVPDPMTAFTVYVDVDPGVAAGSASAQPFGTQAANLPTGFLADYRLRWATDGTVSLARYDGAAWQVLPGIDIQFATGERFVELSVPLAQLGSPARMGLLGHWQTSGPTFEKTFGGWYLDSFVDGDYRAANPAPIAHWLDADLASPIPPGARANKR
jgi:hypothetical protein